MVFGSREAFGREAVRCCSWRGADVTGIDVWEGKVIVGFVCCVDWAVGAERRVSNSL